MFIKILGVIIVIPSLPKKANFDLPRCRWLSTLHYALISCFPVYGILNKYNFEKA